MNGNGFSRGHGHGMVRGAAAVLALLLAMQVLRGQSVVIALSQVGNPNNLADTATGYGSVPYTYDIGTFDVTETQYAAFLNSVAASDRYGLYNPGMATAGNYLGISTGAGIVQSGTSGGYSYSVIGSGQYPVTCVSWLDAARFCNWLQNGQPATGVEDAATTEEGAYTLDGDTNSGQETANAGAAWWIPTEDEWYKAAYYNPKLNLGAGGYSLYATQTGTAPGNNYLAPDIPNQANYTNGVYSVTQSSRFTGAQNYLTPVGSFAKSASYYGTYDQAGNVWNWTGAIIDFSRGLRGGSWATAPAELQSSFRYDGNPSVESYDIGFRVATGRGPDVTIVKAGKYTVLLTATDTGATVPQGIGCATLTIGEKGGVMMGGKLPDGESFSASSMIISGTAINQFTIHKSLSYPSVTVRKAKGLLSGSAGFDTLAGSDFQGTVEWMKPQQKKGDYPAAIGTNLSVIGSLYTFQKGGSVLPGVTGGTLELSDTGTLCISGSSQLDKAVILTSSNTLAVTNPGVDNLKLTINSATGSFKGSFVYPGQSGRVDFHGVLFQDQAMGAGFFLGPNGSGTVTLTPP